MQACANRSLSLCALSLSLSLSLSLCLSLSLSLSLPYLAQDTATVVRVQVRGCKDRRQHGVSGKREREGEKREMVSMTRGGGGVLNDPGEVAG